MVCQAEGLLPAKEPRGSTKTPKRKTQDDMIEQFASLPPEQRAARQSSASKPSEVLAERNAAMVTVTQNEEEDNGFSEAFPLSNLRDLV